MAERMKTIRHTNPKRTEILHVETPLGIINIQIGPTDFRGRPVVSVQVSPDDFAGAPKVVRRGYSNTRLVQLKTVKGGR